MENVSEKIQALQIQALQSTRRLLQPSRAISQRLISTWQHTLTTDTITMCWIASWGILYPQTTRILSW